MLQHVGDRRDDGGDSAGQSRGGRDQESPAGLRQGQEGEGDEWVSCPDHHHDHFWPLAECGLDCLVGGLRKADQARRTVSQHRLHTAQGRRPQKYVRLWQMGEI